jgi:hypothetical protein
MALIVKCAPTQVSDDRILDVEVPIYEAASGNAGDNVFVWFAESRGGRGIAMRGTLLDLALVDSRTRRVRIRITDARVNIHFDKSSLAPHRNAQRDAALPKLAYRLYKHSLLKVTNIDADEEAFLQRHFQS